MEILFTPKAHNPWKRGKRMETITRESRLPGAPTMKYLQKLLKKDLSEIMVATMAIPVLP